MNATQCLTEKRHNVPVSPFQVPPLSAHKQTGRVLLPALSLPPNWTVWPGSRRKPEVRSSIFLPPRHIAMTTDIEITLSPGEESPGDTTQWHFCGTRGEQGSFRRAGQGWVFSFFLKRKDQAGGRKGGLGQRAVMRLQALNSPAGKREVTDSFCPKIASKPVKS